MSRCTVHSQTCNNFKSCVHWARDSESHTWNSYSPGFFVFFFSIKHLSHHTLLLHVQGFIQKGEVGGGLEFSPPPEILKLSMVLIVLSQVLSNNLVPDCVRSNLNSKVSWGRGDMPPDPPSRHTHLHVCERAFARYYHPATILFPLPP